MLGHLKIQFFLGIVLLAIVILYHLGTRVVPSLAACGSIDLSLCLPYLVLLASIVYLILLKRNRNESYAEFLRNSPGAEVDTTGIEYGVGHAHGSAKSRENCE
jgi:hypothetical protein